MRLTHAVTVATLMLGGTALMTMPAPAFAQADITVTVRIAPPALPIYDQPPIPSSGYLWSPGYWAWNDLGGYFWVPGTWVLPPRPGLLWTPGYWGWNDGTYLFHTGYWGPRVGFYGGVAYGFGYTGSGYEGGYWTNNNFFYNRTVNNIAAVNITNVYAKTVVVNNTTNVSFNGGTGGVQARPTPQEIAATQAPHVAPTPAQTQHVALARRDPSLLASSNHGKPPIAATPQPGAFKAPAAAASTSAAPAAPAAKPGAPVTQPAETTAAHRLPTVPEPAKATVPDEAKTTAGAGRALPSPGTPAGLRAGEPAKAKLPPAPLAARAAPEAQQPRLEPSRPLAPEPVRAAPKLENGGEGRPQPQPRPEAKTAPRAPGEQQSMAKAPGAPRTPEARPAAAPHPRCEPGQTCR